MTGIVRAAGIDDSVLQMNSTVAADEFVFLELTGVLVHHAHPLVHLSASGLVKVVLEGIVFLLEFLGELPYHVVFHFKQFALLFVMLHESAALSKFSWQVMGVHLNVHLELFCH